MIIVALTNYLLTKLMSAIGGDNFIIDIVGDLLTGIILTRTPKSGIRMEGFLYAKIHKRI